MCVNQKQQKVTEYIKDTISLVEVLLVLLQSLQPVLDYQIDLRITKMVPNDFPCPKTLG